jgi:hypothetical protein
MSTFWCFAIPAFLILVSMSATGSVMHIQTTPLSYVGLLPT